jgi:DNA-directed RNA polymerase specialized sigma24 family protein
MPVEFRSGPANGSPEDQLMADALHDAGQYMYETFAAPLFDYCAGLLGDQVAASDAVQDSLIAVDAQVGRQPEPDQLRVSLYFAARRQCLGRLPGRWFRSAGAASPASGPSPASPASPGGTAPADPFLAPATDVLPARTVGETLPIVTAALARLPDRDREVLNLVFRHGIEGADLAAVLGLSSRRAESLLSGAAGRFGRSAAVVVVLRAGQAGCPVLEGIVSQHDAVSSPLDSKLVRLNRHTESCSRCLRVLGDRAFSPDLISQVPLTPPVGRLRLRIIRTTLALGAYRRKAAGPQAGSGSGRASPAGPRPAGGGAHRRS